MEQTPTTEQKKVFSFIGQVFEPGTITARALPDPEAVEITDSTGERMILAYDQTQEAIIEK